ncbi:MAG: ATP-binding protein, partial [Acidobacteria bacterium]
GVVENMSGDVFGKGGGQELADELNVPLLGSIPLDPAVVAAGDSGNPVVLAVEPGPAAIALTALVAKLIEVVPPAELETCTGRIAKLLADLEDGAA